MFIRSNVYMFVYDMVALSFKINCNTKSVCNKPLKIYMKNYVILTLTNGFDMWLSFEQTTRNNAS